MNARTRTLTLRKRTHASYHGLDLIHAGGPLGLRLDARDNGTAFGGFQGELASRTARNDVQLAGGLTVAF